MMAPKPAAAMETADRSGAGWVVGTSCGEFPVGAAVPCVEFCTGTGESEIMESIVSRIVVAAGVGVNPEFSAVLPLVSSAGRTEKNPVAFAEIRGSGELTFTMYSPVTAPAVI